MLPIEQNRNLVDHIQRLLRRMQHIKEVKNQLVQFITEVQELHSSFAQKIHKEMTGFEERVVKNSLYSTDRTHYVVNMAKITREFAVQIEKNSKINLIGLQRARGEEIGKLQQRLQKKCELFLKEYLAYLQAQKGYNQKYNTYSDKCSALDKVIRRFQSYQDPIAFYNQILTNQYVHELDRHYNDCTNFQTTIINDTQGLDQTRKWMCEHVKEINQFYVGLLHCYLEVLESVINCVVDPKRDGLERNPLGLRNSDVDSVDQPNLELEKLNALYASELNNKKAAEDNIVDDYSQLFQKSFTQGELNSDYKFFYDRCMSIRGKKLKTTDEVFKIQSLLVAELTLQSQNYATFQKNYRNIEKDIFTNNGIDSFKKRFRKYFGQNFMEAQELCLAIVDRQKKSLERVGRSTEDSLEKLKRLMENKQENIKLFEKRTRLILEDHQQLKEKTYIGSTVDSEQLRAFKDCIAQSFQQLKKSFAQLEKSQSEVDSLFFSTLKAHSEVIVKESVGKNLSRTLQKQKIRLNILRTLNINSEVVLILKEDSRYDTLMNDCPKPNLYSNFQSLAKKSTYDQTKNLLQMKETRLKNMIKSKKGCCGIISQPIKHNVLSQHKCKLVKDKDRVKGMLSIASTGLIFQQVSWNPFCDVLSLMIPQSDIIGFDVKPHADKEAVQVSTALGNLLFQSKICNEVIQSMQKNITFKPGPRQASQRGGKRNDSSSFLKSNTSAQYKLTYDKTLSNGTKTDGKFLPSKNAKGKTSDTVNDLVKKWKESNFFSEHFTKIIKDLPQKSQKRRDYRYHNHNGHSKFQLKQRRQCQIAGKDIIFGYEWKVCFPDTPMLHSFKHNQKVYIQGISKDLRIRIVAGKLCEEQLFIRNKFYKQVQEMNERLTKFIVNTLQKQADILMQGENQNDRSLDSCNIVLADLQLQDRESKPQKGDTLRNSRLQRQKSSSILGK